MRKDLIGAELPSSPDGSGSGRPLLRGDAGLSVKLVQEWLTLRGYGIAIDGDFGPATQAALDEWLASITTQPGQEGTGKPRNNVVDDSIWEALWAPMISALEPIELKFDLKPGAYLIPNYALAFAQGHLFNRAQEIGHNQGPWVRLYNDADPVGGHDGPEYPWCSTFVRFCIRQAQILLLTPKPPLKPSTVVDADKINAAIWPEPAWSCDRMADWAEAHGMLYREPGVNTVKHGSVFLVHREGRDWVHTGFVESYDPAQGIVRTIEGNTNIAGSREGIAVMRRYRKVDKLDFITGYGGLVAPRQV